MAAAQISVMGAYDELDRRLRLTINPQPCAYPIAVEDDRSKSWSAIFWRAGDTPHLSSQGTRI